MTAQIKILFGLILLVQVFGCGKTYETNEKFKDDYFYLNYEVELLDDTFKNKVSVKYSESIEDSTYHLIYLLKQDSTNFDTVKYKLSVSEHFSPVYSNISSGEKIGFKESRRTNYSIEGRQYLIIKFAQDPFDVDGCITHFWSPEFGIILKRSATWRDFSKLQCENDSINGKINQLTELITEDSTFYRGCL